jgi:hypothetical protein
MSRRVRTLASVHHHVGEHELPRDSTRLPWTPKGPSPRRTMWSESSHEPRRSSVPGRAVLSAKSWLCHPKVDRLQAILPWGGADRCAASVARRCRRRAILGTCCRRFVTTVGTTIEQISI